MEYIQGNQRLCEIIRVHKVKGKQRQSSEWQRFREFGGIETTGKVTKVAKNELKAEVNEVVAKGNEAMGNRLGCRTENEIKTMKGN